MSSIDELISELATSGVPHLTLGDVARYSDTRVDAFELDETNFVGVDNLVADKGGRVDASYPPNTARLTAYEPGDILIGNIRPYLKKVWRATNAGGCSGDVLAIRILQEHRKSLDSGFLYYLLSSDRFFAYNMGHAKGARMPRGNKAAILDFQIPFPPLKIQREIVRILDQFTELQAELDGELEAELNARRSQYEYYRARLIDRASKDEIWRPLGELASVRTGQAPPHGVPASSGDFAFVNAGTTESGRSPESNTEADSVTIPSRGQGAVGIVGYQDAPFWCGPLCYRIRSNEERLSTRFLYYFLKSIQPSIRALQQTGGTPALNRKELILVEVPLPSIEVQAHVVDVLDRFDALVDGLSAGLLAELTARRKQYEYYRNRLLTFKEPAA
ncbi:restriction endonuclease subunit S [Curtobacterium sp. MCPF17_047]|uniref:restriction endonuclease subunit S n=1 Tax=Curtobacterium sp. MCPF17_047 TaxID=2175654 RepID=UPI000DA9CD47|nr:restriction endonuclease subunit S [Curtobacterium sp. MCPF17_047]PZF66710.1 restriction endonuclease subunit S [Curtobacterium sp. MCPF17_047]